MDDPRRKLLQRACAVVGVSSNGSVQSLLKRLASVPVLHTIPSTNGDLVSDVGTPAIEQMGSHHTPQKLPDVATKEFSFNKRLDKWTTNTLQLELLRVDSPSDNKQMHYVYKKKAIDANVSEHTSNEESALQQLQAVLAQRICTKFPPKLIRALLKRCNVDTRKALTRSKLAWMLAQHLSHPNESGDGVQ